MKPTFLSKLHRNGTYYIIGALILLVGVPLYQVVVLSPQGYNTALASPTKTAYLSWLATHLAQFAGYRVLLMLAFACLISFPFTLFRIIVAQELLGREEEPELTEEDEDDNDEEDEEDEAEENDGGEEESDAPGEKTDADGLPPFAWRGKGFAVLAAWSGLAGIVVYLLGTLTSTLYLMITSNGFTFRSSVPDTFTPLVATFTIIPDTVGRGLLALSLLFFGAMIARSGRNLWPTIWVIFSYVALALAGLFSASAVGVASAPTSSQPPLATPTILLFSLWLLWLGIMLVRLKPE